MNGFTVGLLTGFISSLAVVILCNLIIKARVKKYFDKITGIYNECERSNGEWELRIPENIYKVEFKLNLIKWNSQLYIRMNSSKSESADWECFYSISPSSTNFLSGSYKYLKNKIIPDFDDQELGIHNLTIHPESGVITVARHSQLNDQKGEIQYYFIKKIKDI